MAKGRREVKESEGYEYPVIETLRETEKAVLVRLTVESATVWLPKSGIDYRGTKKEPLIWVADWLAQQRGFEDSEYEEE